VIRELEHQIEVHKPGNASPALSGLVAVFGTTITLIGAVFLAVYNGWFGLVTALTDPATGQVHGITATESNSVVGGITPAIIWFAICFVAVGLGAFFTARNRDKQRATSRVWLRTYKGART
jgi:hypothetical protein